MRLCFNRGQELVYFLEMSRDPVVWDATCYDSKYVRAPAWSTSIVFLMLYYTYTIYKLRSYKYPTTIKKAKVRIEIWKMDSCVTKRLNQFRETDELNIRALPRNRWGVTICAMSLAYSMLKHAEAMLPLKFWLRICYKYLIYISRRYALLRGRYYDLTSHTYTHRHFCAFTFSLCSKFLLSMRSGYTSDSRVW